MSSARWALVVACVASAAARADEPFCSNDQSCPPWQICTTSVGECGSALAPAEVCTGKCESGRRTRVVLRGAAVSARDATPISASIGLELVPPLAEGRLSVGAEFWTSVAWRVGPAVTFPLAPGLLVSARADACNAGGNWSACPGARLEYFPWWQLPWLTPSHHLSITLDGAARIVPDGSGVRVAPLAALGVGVWL